MVRLRGYLLYISVYIVLLLYWPISVLGGVFLPEAQAYKVATFWGRIALIILKYVAGVTCRITYEEALPKGATVVLSKHQSILDIFALLPVFKPQSWVLKRELFRIPFFGWALWATKPIAIDRAAGRKSLMDMITMGTEKLKKGYSVVIYPEGTRSKPGKKAKYKTGGVALAKRAGFDITPVALNTGLFWDKKKGLINTGTIDIIIGKRISTKEGTTKEISDKVEAWIEKNSLAVTLNHPNYIEMQSQNEEKNV